LENRGLDRCSERETEHFRRYIGMGIYASTLKKLDDKFLKHRDYN
jgi:hypothetical protein